MPATPGRRLTGGAQNSYVRPIPPAALPGHAQDCAWCADSYPVSGPVPREGESARHRLDPRDQSGIALIEILVAAILLVIVAVGVFGAFDAATRSTAEERHRARAHALAQADLSRMRTMRVSDLSNLNQTRNVSQDGQTYTIHSRAEYQTDATGTQSCEAGTAAPTTSGSARR